MYKANYLAAKLAVHASDAPFLEDFTSGQTLTHNDIWRGAERMAAALTRLGLRPGDRVAVQAEKSVAMLEAYLGVVLAGGVFLPLNTAYVAAEIGYFLADATPKIFVCDPSRLSELSPVAKAARVAQILTLGDENGSLRDAQNAEEPGFQAVACGPDDLAAILYTSGTTGRSKGAMLSHKALASNSEVLRDIWHFTSADVLIHALPIYHTHGLFVATNVTLMAGASCIFMSKFNAQDVIGEMPRATALMGVPTFYTRLLGDKNLPEAARNMRLFISGSAPLLAETHRDWTAATGHAILERYGMTETNMNTSNPYDGERRPGTVGFALPGVALRICDGEEKVKNGEIGVIEVRGPNVFSGYWQMPEKTAQELRPDGWFISGDLGRIDEDGYLHIVGRGKDLIITGGFNVYPKEVEEAIDALSGVFESAVIGVKHADFGEAVVAVVVASNVGEISEAQVLAGLEGQLARFKQPKKVVFVDALLRNAMGKVQKNLLRAEYAEILA